MVPPDPLLNPRRLKPAWLDEGCPPPPLPPQVINLDLVIMGMLQEETKAGTYWTNAAPSVPKNVLATVGEAYMRSLPAKWAYDRNERLIKAVRILQRGGLLPLEVPPAPPLLISLEVDRDMPRRYEVYEGDQGRVTSTCGDLETAVLECDRLNRELNRGYYVRGRRDDGSVYCLVCYNICPHREPGDGKCLYLPLLTQLSAPDS